jgi:hypothetical protein
MKLKKCLLILLIAFEGLRGQVTVPSVEHQGNFPIDFDTNHPRSLEFVNRKSNFIKPATNSKQQTKPLMLTANT